MHWARKSDLVGPTTRTATSRGYRISYEDVGEGSAVVLLPGFLMVGADWRTWGYVGRLAERYRVLVVDPLGHGLSDKPHEWQAFSKPDIAADAIAVMDAAGVDVAALWGYSRGGGLAYTAAIEFPRRVTTLVIGGTIIGPKVPTPATTEAPPETQALLRGDWEPFFANVYPCPDWERDLHRERSDPAATGAILEGSRRSNYRTDLNLISVSTLLYVADDDVADPDAANALGRDATALKIEAKILEGHNHDTAFEDSDSLVPLVISHLDAVSKPSGS